MIERNTARRLTLHSLGAILLTIIGAILLIGDMGAGDTGRSFISTVIFIIGVVCFVGGIAWSLATRARKDALRRGN